jgi:acyl dehydratase
MIDIDVLKDELLAYDFPDGEFTIADYEHYLCADAILSPPLPEGVAHPMYGYYTAIAGMGITLDELFAAAHSSAEEGPMFGEAGLEFHRPLEIGASYLVRGGFTDAVRKESSRLGFMDLVTFELEVIDTDGDVVAVSKNTFVFPRGRS